MKSDAKFVLDKPQNNIHQGMYWYISISYVSMHLVNTCDVITFQNPVIVNGIFLVNLNNVIWLVNIFEVI